jgi:Eco29kI restriction endonuclease
VIADANRKEFSLPIYVGKAIPKGSRKGISSGTANASFALYDRLMEHAESVQSTRNLKLKDFACRYLVIEDIWIPLGESVLIAQYLPLWNLKLDGFGNHDPGKGRHKQKRSPWDVVHPGRAWAAKLADHAKTAEELMAEVDAYLQKDRVAEPDEDAEYGVEE